MNFHYDITITALLILTCFDITIKSEKYAECDNLPPSKIKILEPNSELRVWLGTEVSITCCMKSFPKIDFDDDIEPSSPKTGDNLSWYDPKSRPITNYFIDPIKAQQRGVFMIPEQIDKYKDILVVHLVIKNFSLADNGRYKCHTGDNSPSTADQIAIIGNPKIIIDAEEYQFLEEGTSGEINCHPRGHPNIEIVWFYEGQHLSIDNRKFSFVNRHETLRIAKVTEDFAGKYLCKAEVSMINRADSSGNGNYLEIQPIQVIVFERPKLSADSPVVKNRLKSSADSNDGDVDNIAAEQDGVLELACDSTGLPPPTIRWYRDNKLLNASIDARVRITESYYRRNAYSVLTIQPVQINDIGVYSCNASFAFRQFNTSVSKK